MKPATLACLALAIVPVVSACHPAVQRVATGDGRCSVSMPGHPRTDAFPVTLEGGLVVKQESWVLGHVGSPETVPPRGGSTYTLRRATTPAGAGPQGMRLLEMAGRRIVADLTTLRYTSPRVQRLDGAVGPAVEVRAGHRETTSVVRLYAVPEGYCEVAIFGARSEEEVTAYFASAAIRP